MTEDQRPATQEEATEVMAGKISNRLLDDRHMRQWFFNDMPIQGATGATLHTDEIVKHLRSLKGSA